MVAWVCVAVRSRAVVGLSRQHQEGRAAVHARVQARAGVVQARCHPQAGGAAHARHDGHAQGAFVTRVCVVRVPALMHVRARAQCCRSSCATCATCPTPRGFPRSSRAAALDGCCGALPAKHPALTSSHFTCSFGVNQFHLESMHCTGLVAEIYIRWGLLTDRISSNNYSPFDFEVLAFHRRAVVAIAHSLSLAGAVSGARLPDRRDLCVPPVQCHHALHRLGAGGH